MTQELKAGMWVDYDGEKSWLVGFDFGGFPVIQFVRTFRYITVDLSAIKPWREKRKIMVPDVWVYKKIDEDFWLFFDGPLEGSCMYKLIHHYPSREVEIDV